MDVSRTEVEAQLQRILRDRDFERNRSASNFLKFVVDETLEGRGPRLKAFTIATDVFGRDTDFDPRNNSIVRVQATRLRQLLHAYYSGPGADDSLRIQMPIGRYQVRFDRTSALASPAEPKTEPESSTDVDDEDAALVDGRRAFAFTWPKRQKKIFGGLVAALAVLGLMLPPYGVSSPDALQARSMLPTPVLRIMKADGFQVPDDVSAFTDNLLDSIEKSLVAFNNVVVQLPAAAGKKASLVTYALMIESAAPPDGHLRLGFRLVREPTGESIWSKDFSDVAMTDSARLVIGESVARAVGDAYGAIMIDTLKHIDARTEKSGDYHCILSRFGHLKDRAEAKHGGAQDCLDPEIAADPGNIAAFAMLSAFLVHDYLGATPGGPAAQVPGE